MSVELRTTGQPYEIPADIVAGIEQGELTEEQVRRLIAVEAAQIGLSFGEAVRRARDGSLPKTVIGSDVELLVMLLPDSP